MASDATKYQINFKTHKDGTLINLYADSIKELETQITDIAMIAALIKSTEAELLTGPQSASSAPTVASVAQSFGATPVTAAPAQPQVVEGQAPTCSHGNMAYRVGTSARGPWRAWMCAAPKGAADKCDPIFLR
jgi:hypothetical protein